jgi:hypothetical protein
LLKQQSEAQSARRDTIQLIMLYVHGEDQVLKKKVDQQMEVSISGQNLIDDADSKLFFDKL